MMEKKTWLIIGATLFFGALFLGISFSIKDTQAIWMQTRIFGLLSFLVLFMVVLLGELRVLTKGKLPLLNFRFHKPLGMFAVFVVFLHGISAMMDNYKWGKGISFTKYLGFSFGDKWLIFLSFGTLAFYLMALIGATSQPKVMQKLGYSRWKLIHYLTYLAFGLAYVHSVNLGTDLKGTGYAVVLHWIAEGCFIVVLGLLLSRIVHGLLTFDDLVETTFAALFFIFIIVSVFLMGYFIANSSDTLASLSEQTDAASAEVDALQDEVIIQQTENARITREIAQVHNG